MSRQKITLVPLETNKVFKTGDFVSFKMRPWDKKNYNLLKKYSGMHLGDDWFMLEVNIDKKLNDSIFTLVKTSNKNNAKIILPEFEIALRELEIRPIKEDVSVPFHLDQQKIHIVNEYSHTLYIVIVLVTLISSLVAYFTKKKSLNSNLSGDSKELKKLKRLLINDDVDLILDCLTRSSSLTKDENVKKLRDLLTVNVYRRQWDQCSDEQYQTIKKLLLDQKV